MAVTDTSATITWTRSTDDVAVDHYTITRNGSLLAGERATTGVRRPRVHRHRPHPEHPYQYLVTAFDGDGNSTASSTGQITTAAPAGAISLIRQATGSTASGTTLTVPITSIAGDALVAAIAVKAGGSVSVSTVTDSTGAAWTKGPVGFLSGSNCRIELWYRTGASALSNVTATLTATTAAAADISEWHGIAAAGALDAQAGIGTAATTTPQTPAATTTIAGDLVIGALNWPGAATSTLTSAGFTSLTDFNVTTSVNGRAAYLIPATTGTYRTAWNLTTAFPAGTAILALKPAPAAPPGGAPTKPGTPSAVSVTDTTATITWTRSTDDVAVDHYTVTRNGTLLAASIPQPTFGDPQFTDTGLTASTTYQYVITAVDGDGNSTASSAGQITTAAPAGAVSLVRQATGSSASGTTLTVPITSVSGDALVAAIAVKAGGSVSVSTVTDSTGAAWTKGPVGFLSGANSRIELWYRTGASAVSNVTATLTATTAAAADISEWHGIAAAGALDAQAGIGTAATTTPQTPAATTTIAGDLVIGALNWPGAATSTLTSAGFTSLTDFNVTTSVNGRAAYLIPATTGTYRTAWNLTTAFPAGTAILALKAG